MGTSSVHPEDMDGKEMLIKEGSQGGAGVDTELLGM
jgi:hypothetical protein